MTKREIFPAEHPLSSLAWRSPSSPFEPRSVRTARRPRLTGNAVESSGDMQPDSFAKFIRSIRLGKEKSLQELAEKLGVSRGHLCNVENGRRRISVASAAEWATALGYHEWQFVLLALQADLDAAGIKLRVQLEAPSHAGVPADIAN